MKPIKLNKNGTFEKLISVIADDNNKYFVTNDKSTGSFLIEETGIFTLSLDAYYTSAYFIIETDKYNEGLTSLFIETICERLKKCDTFSECDIFVNFDYDKESVENIINIMLCEKEGDKRIVQATNVNRYTGKKFTETF